MTVSIQTLRVNNEILSIVNHAGLNPDDAVQVETGISGEKFISIVSGVNIPLARVALLRHYEGRPNMSVKADRNIEYLIVTQLYRE